MRTLVIGPLSSPLAGEQVVNDYAEMEAVLLMGSFSFGAIPNFRTDLEFEIDLNVAAFITSAPQPTPTLNSLNESASAEAVVVSILKRKDRLQALGACLDENSLVDVRVDGYNIYVCMER